MRSRRTMRRLVAATVGAAIAVAGTMVAVAGQGSPAVRLPPIAPERLVASTLRALAERPPISGRVVASIDLGLPALPDVGPAAKLDGPIGFLTSLGGTHRLRVWRSDDGLRVSELLPSSERALFVSRTEAWAWDFSSFTAYRLPPPRPEPRPAPPLPAEMTDPVAVAGMLLDAISPSTSVTVTTTGEVAGRPAYVLTLEPRTTATLVRRVEICIDSERRLPLRVAVYGRTGTAPALSARFTSVSFDPIDPSVYRFSPPPGATVEDLAAGGQVHGGGSSNRSEVGEYGPAVQTFGTGWATVIALQTPSLADLRGAGGFDPSQLLPLSGPLLSIRLVDRGDHGWLVYGAVPQAALVAVEDRLR